MLLSLMIILLLVFCLLGMEIAWAIGIACLGYLALSQIIGPLTPFVLFAQQMTVGVDSFVFLAIPQFWLGIMIIAPTRAPSRSSR